MLLLPDLIQATSALVLRNITGDRGIALIFDEIVVVKNIEVEGLLVADDKFARTRIPTINAKNLVVAQNGLSS